MCFRFSEYQSTLLNGSWACLAAYPLPFPLCSFAKSIIGLNMWNTYFDVALFSSPVLAFLTTRIHHAKMHSKSSSLNYFLFTFASLLLLRYAASTYLGTPQQSPLGVCTSVDQPNPIASLYPNNATGTLNGTVAVIPISLALARQLIPPQYGILEHAYRALLPNFPKGMYPAIMQAVHDHEVQAFGYKIDDFSVRRHQRDTKPAANRPSALASNSPLSTCSTTTPPPSSGRRP